MGVKSTDTGLGMTHGTRPLAYKLIRFIATSLHPKLSTESQYYLCILSIDALARRRGNPKRKMSSISLSLKEPSGRVELYRLCHSRETIKGRTTLTWQARFCINIVLSQRLLVVSPPIMRELIHSPSELLPWCLVDCTIPR
jgi:hypothetical protein